MPGATGYPEAAAQWRAGARWLDSATGAFLRHRPALARHAARDYLGPPDYLTDEGPHLGLL